jgi:hypothetical protein
MGNYDDISGRRFGKLTALKPHHERGPDNRIRWLCACDCGGQIITEDARLKSNNTRSCGCMRGSNQYAPSNVTNANPKPHPIGLTDIQNETLADFVHRLIPIEWRERFYSSVMDELMTQPSRTNAVLLRILYTVKDRLLSKGRLGNDADDRALERRLA